MDISRDLKLSFTLLKKHQELIIPSLISIFIAIGMLFIFIELSGLGSLVLEFNALAQGFDGQPDMQQDAFEQYLVAQGFGPEKWLSVFTLSNLALAIVCLTIGFLASLYFTSIGYAMIARSIKKGKVKINYFKLISVKALMFFIFAGPLLLLLLAVVAAIILHPLFGVLVLLLMMLIFIGYLVFVTIRLFYSIPSLYFDKKSPAGSLRHSFALTEGYAGQVFLLCVLLYAINLLSSSASNELGFAFLAMIEGKAWGFALIAILIVFESIVMTYERILWFYSYEDIR